MSEKACRVLIRVAKTRRLSQQINRHFEPSYTILRKELEKLVMESQDETLLIFIFPLNYVCYKDYIVFSFDLTQIYKNFKTFLQIRNPKVPRGYGFCNPSLVQSGAMN